jgi:hypothetical protein
MSSERIEKTATGPVEAFHLDVIVEEMQLVTTDSIPKLDRSTVRIETIEDVGDGMRRVTISGEKSKFCPTYDEGDDTGSE